MARKAKKKRKGKAGKKKKTKKSTASHIKSKSLLAEALKDIEAELTRLKLEKCGTENDLRRLANSIENTQDQELELKNKINKLVLTEEQLNLKKMQLIEKIEKVKQKIEKVTQIGAEMEEV